MLNLAIFYGGKSVEHDISIITAIQVMRAIDTKKYKIYPIYIRRDNSWVIPNDHLNINNYAENKISGTDIISGFFNKAIIKKSFLGYRKFAHIDCAINCCHGLNGEDGTLSGILELAQIPYVGSGVMPSAVGMDKAIMKDVFISNDIPCVKYLYFTETEFEQNQEQIVQKIEKKLNYPIIVKPANLGSSIGINISKNRDELFENIEISLNFDKKVVVEEVISNLREINCSVIGNYNYTETSILEEPKNWTTFLDFSEKYLVNSESKREIDIHVSEDIDNQIKCLSKKIFKLFGCCGVIRIDFLLDYKTNELFVNEINTIPGSFANYLWRGEYSFKTLVDKLVELAIDEYKYKNLNKYTYQSCVLQNFSCNKTGNKNKFSS